MSYLAYQHLQSYLDNTYTLAGLNFVPFFLFIFLFQQIQLSWALKNEKHLLIILSFLDVGRNWQTKKKINVNIMSLLFLIFVPSSFTQIQNASIIRNREGVGGKKDTVRLKGCGFWCMELPPVYYILSAHHQQFLSLLELFLVFIGWSVFYSY